MNKIIYTALLLMTFNMSGQAQTTTISLDVPRVVPVSPTAAAMEKYLSYPVDHSTGIPNISIPLYEIVAGEVTIPVSLSYHASGLKPKEASSYAGTGWALNLEPSVSRQVCGLADDEYPYGWFNNPASGYNPATAGEEDKITYYNELVDNVRDTRPDRFSYRLPNGSGSGYFIDGTNFVSIPRNNDRVEYHNANGMSITDARGVKYLFNGEREIVEDNTMRWMCKSIWSPNNTNDPLVAFSYTTSGNSPSLGYYYNLNDKVIINRSKQGSNVKNTFTINPYGFAGQYYAIEALPNNPEAQLRSISASEAGVSYSGEPAYRSEVMASAWLNRVDFLGNEMTVVYKNLGNGSPHGQVLDSIGVRDHFGTLVRSIKFYITPYNPNTDLTKLDSVVISAPGAETRKYTFAYNNTLSVPSEYTKSVDHWGFCNGADVAGESTVPSFRETMGFPDGNGGTQNLIVTFAGANREPNHGWTKTGVLNSITDPQGITTTFTYEGNFGAFRDNSKPYNHKDYLHPVGGLRIKRIETRDPGTGKWIRKNYSYGLTRPSVVAFEPVWGGGAIKHIVTMRDYVSSVTRRTKDQYTNVVGMDALTTYGSMPASNITFNGGSAVMYNIVREEVTNSADDAPQRTDYYYNVKLHNFEDVLHWDDADPAGSVRTFLREQPETVLQQIARVLPAHPQEPSDDYVVHNAISNQLYGKLARKDRFRNGRLASQTDYRYKSEEVWSGNFEVDMPHRLIIGDTDGLAVNDVFTIGNYYPSGSSPEVQTTYYLDTEIYKALEKETESTYYDIDGRQDVVTTEKVYDYQFDMTNPGSSLAPRRIQTTGSDGTVVVDSMDYLLGYPAILSRHKHMVGNSWKESRILFKPNSSLPEKVQSRNDRVPVFKDEIKYNAYDSYGNVTELMGKDGMPISFIWGYWGQLPIAKIENATIQQVYGGTDDFETWGLPPATLWSRIEQLRTTLPQARITTFGYRPLQGMIFITDPNNMTTKFDYDHYGRLTDSYFMDVKSATDIRKAMLQKYIYQLGK